VQKQKRLLRLEQIFHSKASEFREAVAAILGVKFAFYPNGQVRVTSIFDLNASFVFQPGSTATEMQLVAQGEGGPQDLPRRNSVSLALLLVLPQSVMRRERRDDSVDCSIAHEIMTPLKSTTLIRYLIRGK